MVVGKNYQASPKWLDLGEGFHDVVEAAPFPKHQIRYRNQKWAQRLGLNQLSDQEWVKYFAEFNPLPDNLPQPLALRYHGHQFTHYNPDLGDGRGFLFAQMQELEEGRLLDLGTKGSGQTPYSRRGDGRLTLKGAVREALATTYLESKGVNTSKTFSVIETGEELERNDEPSPTRSAVLVRLSHSHIRFGTFQRLAYFKEKENMQKLIDYCITNFYPKATLETLFSQVSKNVAKTTAQWMIHGFVHGVLNTDNMNITGESFDYGPYRLLPHYDPKFTAAYFDHQGLYAYGQQPRMVLWNLEQLAAAWSLVIDDKSIFEAGYKKYQEVFEEETFRLFAAKIGVPPDSEDIKNLFYNCLQFLEKSKAPYEAFFHHLYLWHQDLRHPLRDYNPELYNDAAIEEIQKLLGGMQRSKVAVEKGPQDLHTLLIDEIETIWSAIDQNDDWSPFENKIASLERK